MGLSAEEAKLFKSKEDVVSMFLGLAIVLVISFLVFSYFQRKKAGSVSVPGVSDTAIVRDTPLKVVKPTETRALGLTKEVVKNVPTYSNTTEYVVVKGDSLWKIAEKLYGDGFKWTILQKENGIKNPSSIDIGQKLLVPETTIAAKAPTFTDDTYVVKAGDHLSKIALMAYGDSFAWSRIYTANRQLIRNPSIIQPGWKLTIPR